MKGVAVTVPLEEVQVIATEMTIAEYLQTVLVILDKDEYRMLLSAPTEKES